MRAPESAQRVRAPARSRESGLIGLRDLPKSRSVCAVSQMRVRWVGLAVAAFVVIIGSACGYNDAAGARTADVAASDVTVAEAATTLVPVTTDSAEHEAVRATGMAAILSVPYEIGPLPAGVEPVLSAQQVFDLVAGGSLSYYFLTAADRSNVSIEVGLILDHTLGDAGANDPTFVGYVIEGGHSECVSSGPPGGIDDGPHPCHGLAVVNGDTGQIVTEGDIGEPGTD